MLAGVLDWVAQLQLFQPKQQLVVAALHECTIAAVILELTECIGGRCNEIWIPSMLIAASCDPDESTMLLPRLQACQLPSS